MNNLVVKQKFPSLQLGYDVKYLVDVIIEAYVDRVEGEDIYSDYNYRTHNFFIPSIPDYLADNETIEEIIDDIAAHELYGQDIMYAMADVEDKDMDEFMEGFYDECNKQSQIFVGDVFRVVDFYKLSFCMNPEKQKYINFPLRKVW